MIFNADEETNKITYVRFVDDIRASYPNLRISFTVPYSTKQNEKPDFSYQSGSRIIYSGISWIPLSYRLVKTSTTSWQVITVCLPAKAVTIINKSVTSTNDLARAVNAMLSRNSTSIDIVNPQANQYLAVLMNRFRMQSFQQFMKNSGSVKPLYLHLGYENKREVMVSKDFTTIARTTSGSIQFQSKLEASSTQISFIDDTIQNSLVYKRSPQTQTYKGYIASLFTKKLELRGYTDFGCMVGEAYTALTGIDNFIANQLGNKVVCLRKVIDSSGNDLPVHLVLGVYKESGALLEVK